MAGEVKTGRVFRKQCVKDCEEAWEFSPDDLEKAGVQCEMEQLKYSLEILKERGVRWFSYGGIITPGVGEFSFGYPGNICFQRDRSYSSEELDDLHRYLMAPGWLLLDNVSLLLPEDVVVDLVHVHLEIDLGDEHLQPLITGRITTVRIDGQAVWKPIRLM